jgi:hypothetical protein
MKKQNKSNWQTILFAAIATVVFIFAANSPASAQTTYKVGDRAETMSAGEWVEVEIIKVEDNGDYLIRYIKTGISGAWAQAKHLRPIKTVAPNNNQNKADNQGQNKRDGNNRADNQTPDQKSAQTAKLNRFGARDPRTCADTKAPAKGAITAAHALKYLNCQMEGIWSNDLYLVENVKVEVGDGMSYAGIRGQYSLNQIDVNHPVYPIRGSLVKYQCYEENPDYSHSMPGKNCNKTIQPKATGY